MKVVITFTGDPNPRASNPAEIVALGTSFPLGKSVDIDAASPEAQAVVARMRKNSHFKVDDFVEALEGKKPKAKAKAESKADSK